MYDLWRVGYVRRPLTHVMGEAPLPADGIVWLPESPRTFQYVADPFGIVRDGVLTIFVEAFDYRVRRGDIRYFQYDSQDRLIGEGVALQEPWHLSYPTLIEDGGELFMLPEGYKNGELTLYRCKRFPDQWEPACTLLDQPAIDATVVRHDGRWWMFHALPGADDRAMRELHVAWADSLTGPWTPHAANPVREGFRDTRPGGTAFVYDGAVHLPVQDCETTYGARVRLLRIDELTPERFSAQEVRRFEPEGRLTGYDHGLHTLSGDANVTLIDVKSINQSSAEGLIKARYKLRRLFGRAVRKAA
ncbi:hypothetical protein GCM10009422_28090 [Brevundimonas kwangchunensis]|uniref:Glucosamine inositolphosphorylceramide transferase 1 N-terminal domain-containing protein n=1 Tax=Brevundimonas kwangchunensis TaxID=322163 RepID=A0ABN1H546_9CAUL